MEDSSTSGGGTGIGPDPYSHLIATPHPVDVEANNPNSPINLPHGASLPFSPAVPIHAGRKRSGDPHDNIPNRFELFLLGEGEKKITEATDTRTFSHHRQLQKLLPRTDNLTRHSEHLNLYRQQGGSYPCQSTSCPPSQRPPRHFRGLQGHVSHRSICSDIYANYSSPTPAVCQFRIARSD